jgi:hypothetical protein
VKIINARVIETGQPRQAYYLGTHVSGTKHYMEIRYHQRQARKWVKAEKVTLHEGVELRFCEKVSELFS